MLTEVGFVADINSDDSALREVCLPHAKRFSACFRTFITANPDFKQIETLVFQWLEIALVVLRVPVAPPLVCIEEKSEAVQVVSVPQGQYALRGPNKIVVLRWRKVGS